jgi:uncharacterized membrane protein
MAFNVPLNDGLAAAAADVADRWADYLKMWVMWNSVRAAASLVAGALLIGALAA